MSTRTECSLHTVYKLCTCVIRCLEMQLMLACSRGFAVAGAATATVAPHLGRLDGLLVNVLHVLVAQPGHRVPRAQRDQRGGRTVARNRTANDGPQQHGAEAEQAAAQHAVGGTALRLDRLQMGAAPQVQGGADQRVQQQKVGHVLGGDEADTDTHTHKTLRQYCRKYGDHTPPGTLTGWPAPDS